MRRDGALLTLDDCRQLGSVGDSRMSVAEISKKFGLIPPGDKESTSEAPSGDKESPSSNNGSLSGTEGRQKEAIASGTEGGRGRSGRVGKSGISGREGRDGRSGRLGRLIGNSGIDGSCTKSSDLNSNVETISFTSTCRSRLEVTSDVQTSASNSPSK